MSAASIAPFYRGWAQANDALIAAIAPLTNEQLALTIRQDWPIWASAAHLAGARVYWLCTVHGEAGAETTPFTDPTGIGWEDDLAHPRHADELVFALTSTWRIVARCLETWTPEMLSVEARRVRADGVVQAQTRQAALWRILTHDVFHAAEISHVLGANGLGGDSPNGPIDIWAGLARVVS